MNLVPKKVVEDESPLGKDRALNRERALTELEPFGRRNVAHKIADRDHIARKLDLAEVEIDQEIKRSNVKSQELRDRR